MKRRLFLQLALVALFMLVGVFSFRWFLPSHPLYGAIYETSAFDLNEALSNPVGVFLRKHLPTRIVQSPSFPSRFKNQPKYMDLKGTPLEWSIGGTNTGWIYFWDPERLQVSAWEFAPSSETNLLSVQELPTKFYGSLDPRREQVFGNSTTNAIKVTVGQVLFARQTDATNTIYILKLVEQDQNKLIVNCCVATP